MELELARENSECYTSELNSPKTNKKSMAHIFHHIENKKHGSGITLEEILNNPDLLEIYLNWGRNQKD
jgi:hypothetical protein